MGVGAGVVISAKVGEGVEQGQPLCTLHTSQPLDAEALATALAMAADAFTLGAGGSVSPSRLIKYFVDNDGVYDYDYAADGH